MFAFSNKPRKSSVFVTAGLEDTEVTSDTRKVRKPTHNILKDVGG